MRSCFRSSLTLTASFAFGLASLLAASAQQTLWYNGDLFGQSATTNRVNSSGVGAHAYDDFIVPESQVWNVTSVWSNDFFAALFGRPNVTQADWSIRSGMSEGNGGTVIAGGISPITFTRTGRNPNFLYQEWTVQVNNLNVTLAPGLYWLNVTPVAGEAYNSVTSGQNAIGLPPGNDGLAFLDLRPDFVFASRGSENFSLGAAGTAVPEPHAIPILGALAASTAMFVLSRRRRRQDHN
jgi:hypothetical protein